MNEGGSRSPSRQDGILTCGTKDRTLCSLTISPLTTYDIPSADLLKILALLEA